MTTPLVECVPRSAITDLLLQARDDGFHVRDLPSFTYFRCRGMGFAVLRRLSDTDAMNDYVWVSPPFRRLGIGGRLVDARVKYARECGYRKVYAEARPSAVAMLLARGWLDTGRKHGDLTVFMLDLGAKPHA